MIVVERNLAQDARESDREPPARVDVAEQHVRRRVPRLDAQEPRLDDRRHMVRGPFEDQRPAVHQDQHDGRACRRDRLQELLLDTRQTQRRTTGCLAAHVAPLAEHEDRDFRLAGRGDGGREAGLRRVVDPRPLGVQHRRHPCLDPLQHRDDILGAALRVPRPERLFLIIGERTDDGDGAGFVERQQRPLVPQ